MAECLAVLCRMRGATAEQVQDALTLLESLGMSRIPMGHELLQRAARYALESRLSGYDAIYVALASLSEAIWLTADERAARRVRTKGLARALGLEGGQPAHDVLGQGGTGDVASARFL